MGLVFFISYFFPNIYEISHKRDNIDENYFYLLFTAFITIFIFPPLEEFIFRYPLIYKEHNYTIFIYLPLILLIIFIPQIITKILLSLYLILLIIQNFKKKDIYILYIISILSFSFIHLSLFDTKQISSQPFYSSIILVFPQLITGICISYIRIKNNFKIAIYYHIAYNFFIYTIISIP